MHVPKYENTSLTWITPQQIAQHARVWDIRRSLHFIDLLQRRQFRRQSAVHAQYFVVDDGHDGQAIEAIGKRLPQLDRVPSFALVVKAINSIDGSALVIPAQQKEIVGVFNFVRKQQTDGFQ